MRCPVCKKEVESRLANEFFPFCSRRCKLIDLGKWLGEEYRLLAKPEESEDEILDPNSPSSPTGSKND